VSFKALLFSKQSSKKSKGETKKSEPKVSKRREQMIISF